MPGGGHIVSGVDLIGGVDRAGQTRRSGRAVGRRTGFLAAAGVSGGLVLAAGPAQAHTALVRMDPANGATVRRPPVAVTLIFNEAVEPRYAAVVVTDWLTAADARTRALSVSYKDRGAILPIGDFFTMGIDDALRAADFVGVTKIVGVHYDTFPPIKLDRAAATKAANAAGKELLLPTIGETIDI